MFSQDELKNQSYKLVFKCKYIACELWPTNVVKSRNLKETEALLPAIQIVSTCLLGCILVDV